MNTAGTEVEDRVARASRKPMEGEKVEGSLEVAFLELEAAVLAGSNFPVVLAFERSEGNWI
jgi:hypothetical protein